LPGIQSVSAQDATPSPYPQNKTSPILPPVNGEITLHAPHTVKEIAPNTNVEVWGYDGSGPGPILHVKEGEQVNFTLINDGAMPHSIDFHAAQVPWDKYYQSVAPGAQASFSWTPNYPGSFMYHCGTTPVLMHIANGMMGAIITEPKDGWPEQAREYVLVEHEWYLTDPDDQGVRRGDYVKMTGAHPDFVMFNGYYNQYAADPLVADPGELIRIHVVNAGPTLFSAFHVIGALFEAAYPDGNPANRQVGMQTVTIPPGGGYVVELRIPDEGVYPFVTHSFAYTGLGALGLIMVGNPDMSQITGSH
jgi:nitrite reductase (NO-forming)